MNYKSTSSFVGVMGMSGDQLQNTKEIMSLFFDASIVENGLGRRSSMLIDDAEHMRLLRLLDRAGLDFHTFSFDERGSEPQHV